MHDSSFFSIPLILIKSWKFWYTISLHIQTKSSSLRMRVTSSKFASSQRHRIFPNHSVLKGNANPKKYTFWHQNWHTYSSDVLWGQPIRLIQVFSTFLQNFMTIDEKMLFLFFKALVTKDFFWVWTSSLWK